MSLLCCIRYRIDPFKRDEFEAYAREWLRVIPACGGRLLGYFLPHEGSNDIALGLIEFDSLADYEGYRTRLKADPAGRANFEFAETERLILREERSFPAPGDAMILVLFELDAAAGRESEYFDLAAALKPELATIDGFISIERFESLATPGRYLSLSVWRDEDAVKTWRNRPAHRGAQARGRGGVLAGYRLRVAQVLRDYGHDAREEAPADSREVHG